MMGQRYGSSIDGMRKRLCLVNGSGGLGAMRKAGGRTGRIVRARTNTGAVVKLCEGGGRRVGVDGDGKSGCCDEAAVQIMKGQLDEVVRSVYPLHAIHGRNMADVHQQTVSVR